MKEIDDCPLHSCNTVLQVVSVVDALRPGLKSTPEYVKARRDQFPNSNDVVSACGVRRILRTTSVAVCEECCRQRDDFLLTKYPRWSATHELAS